MSQEVSRLDDRSRLPVGEGRGRVFEKGLYEKHLAEGVHLDKIVDAEVSAHTDNLDPGGE